MLGTLITTAHCHPTRSLALPPCTARAVFEKHTACRQIVADAVSGGEVAASARRQALFDEPLDLFDRHGRTLLLVFAQAQHTEHAIELVKRRAHRRSIATAYL